MLKKLLQVSLVLSLIWFSTNLDLKAYEVEKASVGNLYTLEIENLGTEILNGITVFLIDAPDWVI